MIIKKIISDKIFPLKIYQVKILSNTFLVECIKNLSGKLLITKWSFDQILMNVLVILTLSTLFKSLEY